MNNVSYAKIRDFRDLNAWKKGHELVLAIYSLTRRFPKEELFGLSSQMRRSAVSITSNIAEGFSRRSYKEKVYFFIVSAGSLTELQNQLLISKDVKYITEKQFCNLFELSVTVQKILSGLTKKTRSKTLCN